MNTVQRAEEIEIAPLRAGGLLAGGLQVQDRRSFTGKFGAAVERWKPARRPGECSRGVVTLGVAEHDVCGQVLVFRAEAVADPRSERRSTLKDLARHEH